MIRMSWTRAERIEPPIFGLQSMQRVRTRQVPFSVRPVENGSERGCAATVDSIRMRKKFVPPDSSPMWPFGNGFPVLDVAYYIERKATLAIPGRCETVD